jgi:G3E family GTPase
MREALLVTGFLGAGKTTFITDELLPLVRGRQFALLVNDFGEVGFDAPHFRRQGLSVVEVAGGCVCCAASGELTSALRTIAEELRPELLIVEGSGVASPWPLLEALDAEGYWTTAVVALVDPLAFTEAQREPVFLDQIDAATLVVVSKCALAPPEALAALTTFVRTRRQSDALLLFWDEWFEQQKLALHLGLDPAPPDPALKPLAPTASRHCPSRPAVGRPSASPHSHAPHETIARFLWQPEGVLSVVALEQALAKIPGLYRAKGVIECAESLAPLAFNWAFGLTATAPVQEATHPHLVLLGPAAGPEIVAHLPPSRLWEAIADHETLPRGECDARQGVGYIDGALVGGLDAAEALVAHAAEAPELTLVAGTSWVDPAWTERLAALGVRTIPLPEGWQGVVDAFAAWAEHPTRHLLIIGRSAAAEALVARLHTQTLPPVCLTATPTYALPRSDVAVNGIDRAKAAALLDLIARERASRNGNRIETALLPTPLAPPPARAAQGHRSAPPAPVAGSATT